MPEWSSRKVAADEPPVAASLGETSWFWSLLLGVSMLVGGVLALDNRRADSMR